MGILICKLIFGIGGALFGISALAYVCVQVDEYATTKRRLYKWKKSQQPRVIVDNEWVKWTRK